VAVVRVRGPHVVDVARASCARAFSSSLSLPVITSDRAIIGRQDDESLRDPRVIQWPTDITCPMSVRIAAGTMTVTCAGERIIVQEAQRE